MLALFRSVVRTRLWVALCVTALSAFCVESLPPFAQHAATPSVPWVIFFATLALYNLDDALDPNVQGPRWSRVHAGLTVAAVCALLALLRPLPLRVSIFVGLGFIASAGYAMPLPAGRRGLKSIPGLKAPFVGTAVAISCVGVPALCALPLPPSRNHDWALSAVLALCLGTLCTANALLFDTPDRRQDRARGVPTLIRARGIRRTKTRCALLCAAGMSFASWVPSLTAGSSPAWGIAWALWVWGAALGLATVLVRHTTTKDALAGWVDGSLLIPLAVLTWIRI